METSYRKQNSKAGNWRLDLHKIEPNESSQPGTFLWLLHHCQKVVFYLFIQFSQRVLQNTMFMEKFPSCWSEQ